MNQQCPICGAFLKRVQGLMLVRECARCHSKFEVPTSPEERRAFIAIAKAALGMEAQKQ